MRKKLAIIPILIPFLAEAGTISGDIRKAHDGTPSEGASLSCWINDGSSGIQTDYVDEYNAWMVAAEGFTPPPSVGDTAKVNVTLTVGSKTYTTHGRSVLGAGGAGSIFPALFLDDPDKSVRAQAVDVWYPQIKPSFQLGSDTLRACGWLLRNPDQKIYFENFWHGDTNIVDTALPYPRIYLNLEKQDSNFSPLDSFLIKLYLSRNDTNYFADTVIQLDTLKHGMATAIDEMWFPESFSIFKDISLEQIIAADTVDSGSVLGLKLLARNNGQALTWSPWFFYELSSQKDSSQKSIAPGLDTVEFNVPITLPVGSYLLKTWHNLNDDNPSNDSLEKIICVKKPYKDIALLEILSPPDTVQADSSYNVIVRLKNQSSLDDSARIACEIKRISPDSLVYSDSSKLYLPAGSVQELQFANWLAPYDGQLYLVKFKNLVPDSNATNDSLMKQVYVKQVNVSDFENARKEKVIKAWPIPASAYLNLWLPKNAKASVYDVSGNYITELKNKNGSALWNLTDEKGRKVANGIYFIKIEDEKQRKIEKAAVIR